MHIIRAILLMIFSMALLALSDLFIKLAAGRAPFGQIMLYLSLGGTALLAINALIRRDPIISRDVFHPMIMLRNAFEIIGGVGLVLGIALVPLSTFAAIMQIAPILVVMGGALFLGETVGWRRWGAVIAGLIGMLIVLRPGTDAFSPNALFAVMGVCGLAGRDLVTRLAPSHLSSSTLSTWGFASTIPNGVVYLWFTGDPLTSDPIALWHIALAVLVTTTGYLGVTTAMRMAPVSIVSPFRYTRLVFTTSLGVLFLGERPDGATLLGASIILCAGLYTFLRERRLALAADKTG